MSLQYGAEETPLAGSYGAADSFPKDFGYGVEEEEEEAAAGGGGGAGAGGGCGPGGADSSKPRILLMGLRRSGKSSIQKVSAPHPPPALGPARPTALRWRLSRRPEMVAAWRCVPRHCSHLRARSLGAVRPGSPTWAPEGRAGLGGDAGWREEAGAGHRPRTPPFWWLPLWR